MRGSLPVADDPRTRAVRQLSNIGRFVSERLQARCGTLGVAGTPAEDPIEELFLPKDDVLRVQGSVVETLPNAMFSVKIDGGLKVLARASGKMRRGRFIRILPGDRVDVELSAYDPSRGRIVWRYK